MKAYIWLTVANQVGTLKGVLWHQGEGDTGDVNLAYGIKESLLNLIDGFRKDIQNPYLPWIIGGISSSKELISKNFLRVIVWNRLKDVGQNFLNTGYVRSQDVPFIPIDPIHFSSAGQRIMGERYAIEYLRVAGYWTEKGKEWLDAEADVDEESGLKYHPELGIYWDEHWPIIRHAQLGWLKVSIDQEHVIRLDSPYVGQFRIMQEDGNENASIFLRKTLTILKTRYLERPIM